MARFVPALVAAHAALLASLALSAGPARGSVAHAAAPAPTAAPFLAAPGTHAAPASPTAAKLRAARTFSFALGARLTAQNVTRLRHRDLVVVDGEEASAAQVRRLRAKGAVVLGYLSVGSVESWRSWFGLLRDHRLEPLGDWDGERYADTSSAALRDALADQIAPSLLAKGFDGLFLDNVDMVEEHAAQAEGMFELVSRLSARVRGQGGVLMAQNGDAIIGRYLPLLDGWNREDPTGTYDFVHDRYVRTDSAGRQLARQTLRTVKAAGVVTTTTDYFASPRAPGAARAVRIACSIGAIPTIGDIALRQVAKRPARCPGDPGR